MPSDYGYSFAILPLKQCFDIISVLNFLEGTIINVLSVSGFEKKINLPPFLTTQNIKYGDTHQIYIGNTRHYWRFSRI